MNILASLFLMATLVTLVSSMTNGHDARDGEVPWHASLVSPDVGLTCGGVIIGDHWVLTAAACIYTGVSLDLYKIRYGTINSEKDMGIEVQVSQVHFHPEAWHGKLNQQFYAANLALLKFHEPLKLNQTNAQKIPLADKTDEPESGFTFSAWNYENKNQTGNITFNNLKLKVSDGFKSITFQQCYDEYQEGPSSEFSVVEKKTLCFNNKKNGPDLYDQGGALVSNGKLVGIYLRATHYLIPQPHVFQRIVEYRDWINKVTAL